MAGVSKVNITILNTVKKEATYFRIQLVYNC